MKNVKESTLESLSSEKTFLVKKGLFNEIFMGHQTFLMGLCLKLYQENPKEAMLMFAKKLWEMSPEKLTEIKHGMELNGCSHLAQLLREVVTV
ncbi:MAG: hypothetical protein AAFZ15_11785 [Bacteroidota bacterium]